MSDETKVEEQEKPVPFEQREDIIPVLQIGIIKEKNELAVAGMLGNPELCIQAAADAIKIIVNMGKPVPEKGKILTPNKPQGIITPGQ